MRQYQAFMDWRSANYYVEDEQGEAKVKQKDVLGAQAMLLKIL